MTGNGAPSAFKQTDPCSLVVFGASGDLMHRLLVPALYNRLVHHGDRREWPAIEAQRAAMAEMRVAGKENGHVMRRSAAPNPQAKAMSVCGKSLPLNKRHLSHSLTKA